MPEDVRGYDLDSTEEFAWDCDISWSFDEELGGDDDEDDE
jgi:hypothetical protein